MPEPTTADKPQESVASDTLLAELESEISQALNRQKELTREAEIAQVKCQVVGEYRVRFMDLRDKLRDRLRSANAKPSNRGSEEKA